MNPTSAFPLEPKTSVQARSSAAPALLGLMLAQLVLFLTTVLLLTLSINWPDGLSYDAARTLPLIREQATPLTLGYGAFLLAAFLLIPIAVLARRVLLERGWDGPLVQVSVAFGVLGGVFKILGIVRWFTVMPALADLYLSAPAGSSVRESLSLVFEGFNAYAGGIGESLGDLLFPGIWTLFIALPLLKRIPWLGWSGLAVALALSLGGVTNLLSLPLGELLLPVGITAWCFWCAAFGAVLLDSSSHKQPAALRS